MAGKRDYYEVLEITREANDEDVKRAYRKLAMKYHPDRNVGDEEAAAKFKECSEAYEVLRDPEKKARYDRYGHAGLEGMSFGGGGRGGASVFEDLFGSIFGDVFGGGRGGPQPGRDIEVLVELDLTEAAKGATKTVQFTRDEPCGECGGNGCRRGTQPTVCRRCDGRGVIVQGQGFIRMQQTCRACGGHGMIITDPCPKCRGRGRVGVPVTRQLDIPAGVDTGTRIRYGGEGEAGQPGAPRGDLHCIMKVREHSIFQREGPHLICQVPITFSLAALGGDLDIPSLDGTVPHSLKRGTQSGDVVRISGKGLPNLREGGRRGDLIVQLVVETPRNLTKRQEELFRELAELDKSHVSSPQRKSFLDKLKDFFSPEPSGEGGAG